MARLTSFLAALCAAAVAVTTTDAQTCTNVHLVFARGTGEAAGFGSVGRPLVTELPKYIGGRTFSSYAVNYAASQDQSSAGPGATAMSNYIVSYAARCPNAVFVIGGYSQGASVTDIAIGIRTSLGSGTTIPTALAPRIKAVVTFGNPLALYGQTIAGSSALYGRKSVDDCNVGDPVCANGSNIGAHLSYGTDGSVPAAARRAGALVVAAARSLRGEESA